MENTRNDRTVLIHCMRPVWEHITVKWKLVNYSARDQGDKETLEQTERPKTEPVQYSALKLVVNLSLEGEVDHTSTRNLDRRGFKFHIPRPERVAMCRSGRESGAYWNPTAHVLKKMEEVAQSARGKQVSFDPESLHCLQTSEGFVDYVALCDRREICLEVCGVHLDQPVSHKDL